MKRVISDSDFEYDDERSREEKALMVRNPQKFFKKNFSKFNSKYGNNSKSEESKGGYNNSNNSSFNNNTNNNSNWKSRYNKENESKGMRKFSGDSGYDCHFCEGKNHLARDCMLRKQREAFEDEQDAEYYKQFTGKSKHDSKSETNEKVEKKSENKSDSKALVVQGDEDASMEFWSTGSDDDEIRKPSHGERKFGGGVIKGPVSKCFMARIVNDSVKVDSEVPKMESKKVMGSEDGSSDGDSMYSILDSGSAVSYSTCATCLSTKNVSTHRNECEEVIKKVCDLISESSISKSKSDSIITHLRANILDLLESLAYN